jgi:hypothetical protein
LQAMAEVFPEALPVLVETDDSGRRADLPERTVRIRGFLRSGEP